MKNLKNNISVFCICAFIVAMHFELQIYSDNYCYAVEQISTFDSNIFTNNLSVIGLEVSPKLISNHIVSVLMNSFFDGNWFDVCLFIVRVNYTLYAVASFVITCQITDKYRLLIAPVITTFLMTKPLISLAFDINAAHNMFLGASIPLCLIALALIIKNKNWNKVWILLSIATILHVHEGFWMGLIIGFIWFISCLYDKKIHWGKIRTLPILIISLIIVVLPNLLSSTNIDNQKFIDIYVLWRTPHHLSVMYWGVQTIIKSLIYILIPVIAIVTIMKVCKVSFIGKKQLLITWSLVLFWVLVIFTQFIAVELNPSSTIISMYITKTLKYITTAASVLYVWVALQLIDLKKYVIALAVVSIPLITLIGPNLNLSSIKYILQDVNLCTSLLISYSIIACYYFYSMKNNSSEKTKRYLNIIIFTLLSCTIIFNNVINYNGDYKIVNGNDAMIKSCGTDIWNVANEFKEKTANSDMFIGMPYENSTNQVQLISQRDCYVIYKNTPTNKEVIFEWYERNLLSDEIMVGTTEDIHRSLNELDIEYIFIEEARFEEFNISKHFEIFVQGDEYSFYKVVNHE